MWSFCGGCKFWKNTSSCEGTVILLVCVQPWHGEQSPVCYEGFVGPPTGYKIIITLTDCVETMEGLHTGTGNSFLLSRLVSKGWRRQTKREQMKWNSYQLWIVLKDLYHSCLFCLFSGEFLWLLWHSGPQLLAPSSARPPPLRRPNMVSEDNCSGCCPSCCKYHNRADDWKGWKPSLRASNLQSFMIRDSSQKRIQVFVPQCRLLNTSACI